MVQTPSSTGAGRSKSHHDIEAPAADVSVSEASDNVLQ